MLSIVILTKNEADRLPRCLASLPSQTEIVIVDDYSSDETVPIAKQYQALVFPKELISFADQKNFGLKHTSGDWVLFLDADEYLSLELTKEIEDVVKHPQEVGGYFLPRRTVFLQKALRYGEFGLQRQLRLVKVSAQPSWNRVVHEELTVTGITGSLQHPLWHDPHRDLAHFATKINRYTSLEVIEADKIGTKVQGWELLAYPGAKFSVNYFCRFGFLDGFPGLVMAMMMSYYSFLKKAKIYFNNKIR